MRTVVFIIAVCLTLSASMSFGADFKATLKRVNRGDAEAQFELARMYAQGDGVKQDYTKAREYLEKAAALNHVGAISNLGEMYFNGYGVKQDYTKARELFEKAAALNYAGASYNLGYMYFTRRPPL